MNENTFQLMGFFFVNVLLLVRAVYSFIIEYDNWSIYMPGISILLSQVIYGLIAYPLFAV